MSDNHGPVSVSVDGTVGLRTWWLENASQFYTDGAPVCNEIIEKWLGFDNLSRIKRMCGGLSADGTAELSLGLDGNATRAKGRVGLIFSDLESLGRARLTTDITGPTAEGCWVRAREAGVVDGMVRPRHTIWANWLEIRGLFDNRAFG